VGCSEGFGWLATQKLQQQSSLAIGWVVIYNDKNMLGISSDHVPSQNTFFLSFHDTMQSSHSEYQTYNA
jgi:hypothetical protein